MDIFIREQCSSVWWWLLCQGLSGSLGRGLRNGGVSGVDVRILLGFRHGGGGVSFGTGLVKSSVIGSGGRLM